MTRCGRPGSRTVELTAAASVRAQMTDIVREFRRYRDDRRRAFELSSDGEYALDLLPALRRCRVVLEVASQAGSEVAKRMAGETVHP